MSADGTEALLAVLVWMALFLPLQWVIVQTMDLWVDTRFGKSLGDLFDALSRGMTRLLRLK